MAQIFAEGDTRVQCEADTLVVSCKGETMSIPVGQLETVTELSPCATMGKFLDMRVVALKSSTGAMMLVPLSRGGAHKLLTALQQLRLQRAFSRPVGAHSTAGGAVESLNTARPSALDSTDRRGTGGIPNGTRTPI
ncbi:MAG: hypothetical protein K6T78_00685 [Alicyclobacillus sp.]|nr:hypothetical protein [Alicyclobacillus sp.]